MSRLSWELGHTLRQAFPKIQVRHADGRRIEQLQVILDQRITSTCQQATTSREWQLRPKQVLRWENNLTGWTSTEQSNFSDYLSFPTRESAESYCKRHGLNYKEMVTNLPTTKRLGSTIISGALRKELKPKSYGDNFSVKRKGIPKWP